ncbi:MAG: aldehyde dehydrogenase [Pseudomonadota bacterium]
MRAHTYFAVISIVAVAGFLSLPAFQFSGTAMASTSELEEDEEDYNGILVNEPGADTTFAYCAGCHSERIVAQQGLTREGWEELIEWMVEEQGMGEIEDPDYTEIVDYLTAHYGEDRPNFPN